MVFLRPVLMSMFFLFSGASYAQNCLNYISSGAEAIGDLALCRAAHNGEVKDFACQRFQDEDRMYTVLYDGGTHPQAIYASNIGGIDSVQLVWSQEQSPKQISCNLSRPYNVPPNARLLGAAVCEDPNGEKVPCALYHDETARNPVVRRHMVYFDAMGGGPTGKDIYDMGRNDRGFMAEMAYQLGKAKLESGCCQQQAAAYLQFAYESFPGSRIYQRAFFSLSNSVRAELGDSYSH